MGSNLWSWHSAQPMVEPSQTVEVVRTRSAPYLARYSLNWMPPSAEARLRRLKAEATRWSVVALGIRSPAIWSRVKRSKGRLSRKARSTQSR